MIRTTKFFLILALLFLFTKPFSAVASFGVSPPNIVADRLARNSHYEATIVLSRGQPTEDLDVKAVFDVPEKIRSWFSVDKGEEFVMPKGVQQFPIQVIIDVPKNADYGSYTGYLRVNTVPKRKPGEQVLIAVGGRIDITLQVGDNIISDFLIKNIEILDIKEGEPPKIKIVVQNTGNVSGGPDRADFELKDKYKSVNLGFDAVEIKEEVPPFKTKTLIVKFPIGIKLGLGEYWAHTKVYRGDAIVKELETVFDVNKRTINFLLIGGIVLGVIILLLLGLFIKKKFLRR